MTTPANMAITRRPSSATLPFATLGTAANADDGLMIAVLRYVMGPEEQGKQLICYWTIACVDSDPQDDEELEIHSFNVDNMSKDETAKQVMLLALERLTKDGLREFGIYIDQQFLRGHIESIQNVIPGLHLLKHENRTGARQMVRVREHLNAIVAPLFSERDKRIRAENEHDRITSLSSERSLYVDASVAIGGTDVGVGCVVKDIIIDHKTGEQYWSLSCDAAMTTISKREGSTGAELQAIFEALNLPGLLTKDILGGRRSLAIISDSKWGVELLNALRHGTKPQINEDIKAIWWMRADRIVQKLAHIENVEFKWVKGHGTDLLNDAADRLALSQRRNEQIGIPMDVRETMQKNIIAHTLEGLSAQGIKAVSRNQKEDPTQ